MDARMNTDLELIEFANHAAIATIDARLAALIAEQAELNKFREGLVERALLLPAVVDARAGWKSGTA